MNAPSNRARGAANLVNSLVEGERNAIRMAWDRMHRLPGGKRLFSEFVGRAAPYTGTMGARVVDLQRGRAVVRLPDRPQVRNHLRCVHAIALANLAEMTGNLALGYSLADDARFIVAGIEMRYLAKARGDITATAESPIPSGALRQNYDVVVEMCDPRGELVTRAVLDTLVGPKRGRA